jgi:hypothetical protein
MRKRTAGLILSGVLVTGTAGAVAIVPASAASTGNPVTSRLASIKNALSGLVSDGTLTQAQADKVAAALQKAMPAQGPGGGRGWFGGMGGAMGATQDAAAKALGMTTAELRTARMSGKSLADIAKSKNVSVDTLVKAMVAAAEDGLATAVKDGHLTQAQADGIKGSLTQRITAEVNSTRPMGGPGHGPRGGGAPSGAPLGTPSGAPSGAPSPSGA